MGGDPRKPWALHCGNHLLGEVTLDYHENLHNYGSLKPGPDFPLYQRLFDEYMRLDGLVDTTETDELRDAAYNAREATQDEIDRLDLRFVDLDTGEAILIYDFHPQSERGKVYWRFKREGIALPRLGPLRAADCRAAVRLHVHVWLLAMPEVLPNQVSTQGPSSTSSNRTRTNSTLTRPNSVERFN